MGIVDAHIHLSGRELPEQVLIDGDRLGVDLFVCSSIAHYRHYPSFADVHASNGDAVTVMRQYPDRVASYCYVNPRHGSDALTELRRRIEDDGMVGVKLWVATVADDSLVNPVVEMAIGYDVPLLVHAWRKTVGQLAYESTATHVARLAARYPEAKLLMAHLGGQVESAMNAVAPYPNICVDTSGTPIGGAEVALAVERLGTSRVVFGSDLPGASLASNLGKVLGAGLPDRDLDLVLGDNMRRLLSGGSR